MSAAVVLFMFLQICSLFVFLRVIHDSDTVVVVPFAVGVVPHNFIRVLMSLLVVYVSVRGRF